jgi:hypothetical protein
MPTPSTSPSSSQPVPDQRAAGETRSKHDQTRSGAIEPQLPHEADQSSHSQARGTEQQAAVGKQAYADETGPSQDTDKGPVLDAVYNDKVAPDRGATAPRR